MSGPRADKWLFENGYAVSRAKAQELIKLGHVSFHFAQDKVFKPARASEFWPLEWGEPLKVEVQESPLTQFVSRGGWKLWAAIQQANFPVQGLTFLDVGQSTGGFTDVLLQKGAAKVVGIDVGRGQLHRDLIHHPNVLALEGVHAAQVDPQFLLGHNNSRKYDGWVSDVSFISIAKILPLAEKVLKRGAQGLALVKPQFELDASSLSKKGIVKSEGSYQQVKDKVLKICEELGYKVKDYFPCSIEGGDGNQEFFLHFQLPHRGDANRLCATSEAHD